MQEESNYAKSYKLYASYSKSDVLFYYLFVLSTYRYLPGKTVMSWEWNSIHHKTGFSLVEVLVASLVFILGASASLRVLSSSIQSTQNSIEIEEVLMLAIAEIEQQRSRVMPVSNNELIGDYVRETVVSGCTFTGTTMSCFSPCNETVPICEIVVTVTNPITNEVETLTTLTLIEQL